MPWISEWADWLGWLGTVQSWRDDITVLMTTMSLRFISRPQKEMWLQITFLKNGGGFWASNVFTNMRKWWTYETLTCGPFINIVYWSFSVHFERQQWIPEFPGWGAGMVLHPSLFKTTHLVVSMFGLIFFIKHIAPGVSPYQYALKHDKIKIFNLLLI